MANETHIREVTKKVRLIDADALMKRFYNYYDCVNEFTSKNGYRGDTLMDYEVADMIYNCIENAPTVDAVAVVRCKDCKYYREGAIFKDIKFCFRLRGDNDKPVGYNFSEDDFCSRGERKDNERKAD